MPLSLRRAARRTRSRSADARSRSRRNASATVRGRRVAESRRTGARARRRDRAISALVTYAGVARTTARAVDAPRRSASRTANGPRVRAIARRRRCCEPDAGRGRSRGRARATISLRPPGSDLNAPSIAGSAAGCARLGRRLRNARSRLPCVLLGLDEARERARAPTADRRRPRGCRRAAARPGRSSLRAPKRRVMNAPIDSSASSRRARHEQLGAHAQLARPREQAGARERADARRNAEHRRGRQRMQPPAALDVGEPRRLGRRPADRRGRAPRTA